MSRRGPTEHEDIIEDPRPPPPPLIPATAQVSISLTLCAAFRLSSYLDDVFAPAIWIPVTASFIMENKSASAMATILRRLIGTVLASAHSRFARRPPAILRVCVSCPSFFHDRVGQELEPF